jgi:hypothetical protein
MQPRYVYPHNECTNIFWHIEATNSRDVWNMYLKPVELFPLVSYIDFWILSFSVVIVPVLDCSEIYAMRQTESYLELTVSLYTTIKIWFFDLSWKIKLEVTVRGPTEVIFWNCAEVGIFSELVYTSAEFHRIPYAKFNWIPGKKLHEL